MNNDINEKVILYFIIGFLLLLVVGFKWNIPSTRDLPIEYLPCRLPDVYCHQFNTNETTAYLTFESVPNGTFIYKVET